MSTNDKDSLAEDHVGEEFELVTRKRRRHVPPASVSVPTSFNLGPPCNITRRPEGSTVLFRSKACIINISPAKLSQYFNSILPGQVKSVRVNRRLNIVAVDTTSPLVTPRLMGVQELCGIPATPSLPRPEKTVPGVIRCVDPGIPEHDILQQLTADVPIIEVRRLGSSFTVRVVFNADSLPNKLRFNLVEIPVLPYRVKPSQCRKCQRYGHFALACQRQESCRRCGAQHCVTSCTAADTRCSNFSGPHEAGM